MARKNKMKNKIVKKKIKSQTMKKKTKAKKKSGKDTRETREQNEPRRERNGRGCIDFNSVMHIDSNTVRVYARATPRSH